MSRSGLGRIWSSHVHTQRLLLSHYQTDTYYGRNWKIVNINTGCTYINFASDILWLCLVLFFSYKSWDDMRAWIYSICQRKILRNIMNIFMNFPIIVLWSITINYYQMVFISCLKEWSWFNLSSSLAEYTCSILLSSSLNR